LFGAQIIAEVERLKNVNITDRMTRFFSDDRTKLILDALKKKKVQSTVALLESVGKCSNMDSMSKRFHFKCCTLF